MATARRRLDVQKLDAWLESTGSDRHWLARELLLKMQRSAHQRKGHATKESSVLAAINHWGSHGLSRMYQELLRVITDRQSDSWYLDVDKEASSASNAVKPSARATPETGALDHEPAPRLREGADEKYTFRFAHLRDQFIKDFQRATIFYTTGTNLRRIIANRYLDHVRELLKRDGVVKALMHHPNSKVCEYAMIQDIGIAVSPCSPQGKRQASQAHTAWDIGEYRRLVHNNLSAFCEVRAKAEKGLNLHIRTTNYMLAFGLDAFFFDAARKTGAIYIRFYPLPRRNADDPDKPCIRLDHTQPVWFDFFRDQFDLHWAPARRGGLAQDVTSSYPWQSTWEDISKKLKPPNNDRVFW